MGGDKNKHIDDIIDGTNWMDSELFQNSFKSDIFSEKIEKEFLVNYDNQNQLEVLKKNREQIPLFAVPTQINPLDLELNEKRKKIKKISVDKLYNFLNNIYVFNKSNNSDISDNLKSQYKIAFRKVVNMYSGEIVNIAYEKWPISGMKYQKKIKNITAKFSNQINNLYPLDKFMENNLLGKKNDKEFFYQFCQNKINEYFISTMREKNGTQKKEYNKRK
jgi:hypothetical protein